MVWVQNLCVVMVFPCFISYVEKFVQFLLTFSRLMSNFGLTQDPVGGVAYQFHLFGHKNRWVVDLI